MFTRSLIGVKCWQIYLKFDCQSQNMFIVELFVSFLRIHVLIFRTQLVNLTKTSLNV